MRMAPTIVSRPAFSMDRSGGADISLPYPPPMHRASMNRVVAKIDDPGVRDLAVAAGVVDDGEIPLWSDTSDFMSSSAQHAEPPSLAPPSLTPLTRRTPRSTIGSSSNEPNSTPGGRKQRGGRSAKSNKGLRQFSLKVCNKVKEKKETTYNEVADELVAEFKSAANEDPASGGSQSLDEKNIRRRVYDALNVLMAMDIISKEKKTIRWLGQPFNTESEVHSLRDEFIEAHEAVRRKKHDLLNILLKQQAYVDLLKRNRSRERVASECLQLPFVMISTSESTTINVEMDSDTRQEVYFRFSKPFTLLEEEEILCRIGRSHADRVSDLRAELPSDIAQLLPTAQEVDDYAAIMKIRQGSAPMDPDTVARRKQELQLAIQSDDAQRIALEEQQRESGRHIFSVNNPAHVHLQLQQFIVQRLFLRRQQEQQRELRGRYEGAIADVGAPSADPSAQFEVDRLDLHSRHLARWNVMLGRHYRYMQCVTSVHSAAEQPAELRTAAFPTDDDHELLRRYAITALPTTTPALLGMLGAIKRDMAIQTQSSLIAGVNATANGHVVSGKRQRDAE